MKFDILPTGQTNEFEAWPACAISFFRQNLKISNESNETNERTKNPIRQIPACPNKSVSGRALCSLRSFERFHVSKGEETSPDSWRQIDSSANRSWHSMFESHSQVKLDKPICRNNIYFRQIGFRVRELDFAGHTHPTRILLSLKTFVRERSFLRLNIKTKPKGQRQSKPRGPTFEWNVSCP